VQACPWLFVAGVLAEFVGIVALGFPDLLPSAIRLAGVLFHDEAEAAEARMFGTSTGSNGANG
jgi:hypothetical protein